MCDCYGVRCFHKYFTDVHIFIFVHNTLMHCTHEILYLSVSTSTYVFNWVHHVPFKIFCGQFFVFVLFSMSFVDKHYIFTASSSLHHFIIGCKYSFLVISYHFHIFHVAALFSIILTGMLSCM